MTTLAFKFQNLAFASNITQLNALVQTLNTSVTWDGKRVVLTDPLGKDIDNLGTYDLDILAKKFLMGVHNRFAAKNLTLQERKDGLAIQEKLVALYKTTDDQIQKSWLLTRICSYIREFFSSMFFKLEPYRDYSDKQVTYISLKEALEGGENGVKGRLLAFTEEQFQATFGAKLFANHSGLISLTKKGGEVSYMWGNLIGSIGDICIIHQDKLPEEVVKTSPY